MRKYTSSWLCLLVVGIAAAPTVASAQVPGTMPVQGTLADSGGTPIEGSQTVGFRIYDAATLGNVLHDETVTVDCVAGVFTVYLGTVTALDLNIFNGQPLWLGVRVGTDAEMTPRLAFGTVPYAGFARDAAYLGGVPAADYLTTSNRAMIEGWAEGVCYNTESELTGALDDNYAPIVHTHNSASIDDGTLQSVDLADQAVTPAKLANCTSTGQILKYSGANTWSCASDDTGGDVTGINAGAGIAVNNPNGPAPTVAIMTGGVANSMIASGLDAGKITTGQLGFGRYNAWTNLWNNNYIRTGREYVAGNTAVTVSTGTSMMNSHILVTPESTVAGSNINTYCTIRDRTNTSFVVLCLGHDSYVNWIAIN